MYFDEEDKSLLKKIKFRLIDRNIGRCENIKHRVKMTFQKIFKGYCDEDVWNVEVSIAEHGDKIIGEFIKRVKKSNVTSIPNNLAKIEHTFFVHDFELEESKEIWFEILEDIHFFFRNYKNFEMYSYDKKKMRRLQNKYNRGLRLFCKYYYSLWH